jgi:hypothetical protein
MERKMEYITLTENQINRALFQFFRRRQSVAKCWRKIDGNWFIRDCPFVDDWTEEDYAGLIEALKNTICQGGWLLGAFSDGKLRGFASAEAEKIGKSKT